MCDCSFLCTWLEYFTELVEEINCIDCIKTNLKNSNKYVKHFDLYCEKCAKYHSAKPRISDEPIQCPWYKYFIELLDEINCVNCIKVNVQNSNERAKCLAIFCEKCKKIEEEKLSNERMMFERKMNEYKWFKLIAPLAEYHV